ncbi:unnamed protein product, partial [Prorocentrum cordatum]
ARHRSSAALLRREMADMEARHAAALSRHEDAAARRLSAAERDFAAVLRGMRPAGRAEEAAGEGHPQAAQFATPAGSSRSRSPSPSEQDSLQRALGLLRRRADLAAAAGAGADAELAEALAAERERSERRLVAVERSEGAGGAEGPIAVRSRAPAREPRMAHDPCVPEWRAESPSSECPYGWVFPAPFCPFTVPDELTVGLLLACTYSLLPLVVVVGIAALAVLRREVRELCLLIFSVVVSVPHALLKLVLLGPRPKGSCLLDCGMPSGHSGFAVGLFCVLLAECLRGPAPARLGRAGQVAGLVVSLLPIGCSRVALRDHSVPQVLVGSAVGAAGAGLWLVCLGPFLEAFLSRALGRAAPPAQSAGTASAREPVLDLSLLSTTQHRPANTEALEMRRHHDDGPRSAAAAPAGSAAVERTWQALQEDSQDSAQDSH